MDNNKVNVILQLGWKAKEDILKKMPTSAGSTSSVVSSTASVTSTAAHLTTVSTTPTTAAGTVTSVDKEAENTPVSSLTDSSTKPSVVTNLLEVLEITFISFFCEGLQIRIESNFAFVVIDSENSRHFFSQSKRDRDQVTVGRVFPRFSMARGLFVSL